MDTNEAVQIIEAMADALESNPLQFHIEINTSMSGMTAQNIGGTGFVSAPVAGAPGATAIGYQPNFSGAQVQVEIASKQGLQEMDQQYRNLLNTLREISDALKQSSPDKGRLQGLLDTLKAASWVPNVILSMVSTVLALLKLTAE